MRYILPITLAVVAVALLGYGAYLLTVHVPASIAGAAITAATTIIISTITLTVGRYFEKRKELEALHREKKIPIYDEFLQGLFSVFYGGKRKQGFDLVEFLRKWQVKIVLWGGADVVNSYIDWNASLKRQNPDKADIDATEALVRAIRRELGHDDARLKKDIFARFVLREYELYAAAAKKNPNVALAELAELEKQVEGQRGEV
ncbi:hypothetical protein BH24PSE2_BH24PSE2_16610 [soil metagenome]